MTSPLNNPCPRCDARIGERCSGGPTHAERKTPPSTRETRIYDLDPSYVPPGHDNNDDDPSTPHRSPNTIPPEQGRQIAYNACVDELTKRGHPLPHQRAAELLHHWLDAR